MTTPAQLDYHERAKAARVRMGSADQRGCERQRLAAAAVREAERVAAVVSQYRLATASLANPKAVVERIKRDVARKHGVSVADIDGPRRSAKIVRARHESMCLAYRETRLTLTPLGRLFNRDHTSVLWAIRQHEARMAGTSISRIKGGAKPSLASAQGGGE